MSLKWPRYPIYLLPGVGSAVPVGGHCADHRVIGDTVTGEGTWLITVGMVYYWASFLQIAE